MGYLSIPGTSSAVERCESNLVGYLRFEFCGPCMWCHSTLAKTWSAPVPVVPALFHSFSQALGGAGASADSGGSGVGRAVERGSQRHGEDTWQGHPGPRLDWLVRICAQQAWAKMGALQKAWTGMGPGAEVGWGQAWAGGSQAQDCACLCWERTRARPLGSEAKGLALPPQCSQGFRGPLSWNSPRASLRCPALLP